MTNHLKIRKIMKQIGLYALIIGVIFLTIDIFLSRNAGIAYVDGEYTSTKPIIFGVVAAVSLLFSVAMFVIRFLMPDTADEQTFGDGDIRKISWIGRLERFNRTRKN